MRAVSQHRALVIEETTVEGEAAEEKVVEDTRSVEETQTVEETQVVEETHRRLHHIGVAVGSRVARQRSRRRIYAFIGYLWRW